MQKRIGTATPNRRKTAGCRHQRELGPIFDSVILPGGRNRKKKKDRNSVPDAQDHFFPGADPTDTITSTFD